jgi:hypothetical protein
MRMRQPEMAVQQSIPVQKATSAPESAVADFASQLAVAQAGCGNADNDRVNRDCHVGRSELKAFNAEEPHAKSQSREGGTTDFADDTDEADDADE